MALTDEGGNGMVMPVAPMNYGGGAGGFGSCWGGDGWWIILLLLFAGGWNNGGWGNNGGGFMPFAMGTSDVQRGFDQSAVMSGINDISAGVCGLQNTISTGFAQAEIGANSRQMASMNQNFDILSSLQNCCCENRASIADLKYTVATENSADRTQSLINTRDIIESSTRNTQLILDKLCQQEIDALKSQNIALQNQLNMATLRESQTAQNALIQNGFSQEVDALYNRLSNCPVPSTPVYGRTPIFTPTTQCGCGSI